MKSQTLQEASCRNTWLRLKPGELARSLAAASYSGAVCHEAFKVGVSHSAPMCPVVLKGLCDTDLLAREGGREDGGGRGSTHLLTFTRLPPPGGERSECDEQRSPAARGPARPTKTAGA